MNYAKFLDLTVSDNFKVAVPAKRVRVSTGAPPVDRDLNFDK